MVPSAMPTFAAIVIAVLTFEQGCANSPATPTSPRLPPQLWLNVRTITVGETVTGELWAHGAVNNFDFTAPLSGTFVASVNWSGTPGRIEVWVEKKAIASSTDHAFEGRFPVVAGQHYYALVADGAPWDYDDFSAKYTLSTRIEP